MALDAGNRPSWEVLTPDFEETKYQGKLVTVFDQRTRHTLINAVADGTLEAGVFIASTGSELYGATTVAKPTATGSNILGLSVVSKGYIMTWNNTLETFEYTDGSTVSYTTKGDWYVYSEVPTAVGDPVYFRHTADGGLTRIGAISNVAGTGKDLHPTAKILETITAPGLVAISVDG